MKRSSAGRGSLGNPLRTSNGNSGTRGNRGSKDATGSARSSFGSRSSIGSRSSTGGRPSLRGSLLKKPSNYVPRPSAGTTSSRRSSASGRHGHLDDPRPLNNKAYRDQSIKQLVQFLAMQNYSQQLTPKMLTPPSSRDFYNIFEFMFRFFDPNFQLTKKPVEDVPMAFKRIRYPFPISKLNLLTVGTLHTWPLVLAALTWLREIIEYLSEFEVHKEPFHTGDFDDTNESQYFFEFVEKTYRRYLTGSCDDDYKEEEEELANKIIYTRSCNYPLDKLPSVNPECLLSGTSGEMADMEHIEVETNSLREELKFLREQPDQLLKSNQYHDSMLIDLEKVKVYDSTLTTYINKRAEIESHLDTELAEAGVELQALLQDNGRKEQIYEVQEFSVNDVVRFKMERQELQGSIEAVEMDIKNVEQQVWEEEVNMAKLQQGIDKNISQYNHSATNLHLIPASAKHAVGQDYELTGKVTRFQQEATKFFTIIKPGLLQLKKRVKLLVHQATDECITEGEAADQMAELVAEKTQALVLLNTHQKRLDDNIENSKQAFAAELTKQLSDIDTLQDCLFQLRKQSSNSLKEAQQQLLTAKREYATNQTTRQKEASEYISFLEQVIEMVITHKLHIQDHTEKVYNEVNEAHVKDMGQLQIISQCQTKKNLPTSDIV